MGKPKRADEAAAIYHMLNRDNRRATTFHNEEDYEAFGDDKVAGTDMVD